MVHHCSSTNTPNKVRAYRYICILWRSHWLWTWKNHLVLSWFRL